jgi:hypothetical protein
MSKNSRKRLGCLSQATLLHVTRVITHVPVSVIGNSTESIHALLHYVRPGWLVAKVTDVK